jgi:hypothetical protein
MPDLHAMSVRSDFEEFEYTPFQDRLRAKRTSRDDYEPRCIRRQYRTVFAADLVFNSYGTTLAVPVEQNSTDARMIDNMDVRAVRLVINVEESSARAVASLSIDIPEDRVNNHLGSRRN